MYIIIVMGFVLAKCDTLSVVDKMYIYIEIYTCACC